MKREFLICVAAFFFGFTSHAFAEEGRIFVADTLTYRLYIDDIPCGDRTQRALSFRAEFRDPVLARDPDTIARAALVGAIVMKRWPARVTCIDHNNFMGTVTSYYEGDLMYRGRTHVTQNLREYDPQSGERFGGSKRGTPFSLVLREFAKGAFRSNKSGPLDAREFIDALEKAEATRTEMIALDFIRASILDRENQPFLPSRKPASAEIIEGLELASANGVEGATLHLSRRAGIDTILRQIRRRALEGNAGVTDDEMDVLTENRELIDASLSQNVGLIKFLVSEVENLGISIDPSVPSTNTNSLPVAFEIERALNGLLRSMLTGADTLVPLPSGAAYSCDEDWCYIADGNMQMRLNVNGQPMCTELRSGEARCDFSYSYNIRGGDFLQIPNDLRSELLNTLSGVASQKQIKTRANLSKSTGQWRILPPLETR